MGRALTAETRREFLCGTARVLAAGALAGTAAPLLEACSGTGERKKPRLFEATFSVATLTEDGQTLVMPAGGMDGSPILIVRISPRRYNALSMICTHEGCPVNRPVNGRINCPCHGSQYDLDGNVLRGPAQLSLERYDTTYDAKVGRLTIGIDA